MPVTVLSCTLGTNAAATWTRGCWRRVGTAITDQRGDLAETFIGTRGWVERRPNDHLVATFTSSVRLQQYVKLERTQKPVLWPQNDQQETEYRTCYTRNRNDNVHWQQQVVIHSWWCTNFIKCKTPAHVSCIALCLTPRGRKRNQFSSVCIFLVLDRNWWIFFTCTRPEESRSISYNRVCLIVHKRKWVPFSA